MQTNRSLLNRFLPLFSVLFLFGLVLTAQGHTISDKESVEIINRIRSEAIKQYQQYSGIESEQDIVTQTFDSKTGELQETVRVVLVERDYFYKKAEITVLKYEKDGKELPVSEYEPGDDREPSRPIFDENGPEHYTVKVVGTKIIDGRECYHLTVDPKQKTERHLTGEMYFSMKDLKLVLISGAIAELPFGVKKLNLEIRYKEKNGMAVPSSSLIVVFAHVAFVYPNKKLVIKTENSKQRLMPR